MAISTKFSKLGWALLVHHLDIVAGSLPNCSASHLFVFFFSARTKKQFKISSIPRYMLIDKKGNIVDDNAKRPSDDGIYKDIIRLIE